MNVKFEDYASHFQKYEMILQGVNHLWNVSWILIL